MPSVMSTKTSTSESGEGKSSKKDKSSKKEKPLNETPEEREERKKEKRERKERKELKKLESTRKHKSSSASVTSTSKSVASVSSSPTSVIPESVPLTRSKHSMPSLKMDAAPPTPEREAFSSVLEAEVGAEVEAKDQVQGKSEKVSSKPSKSASKPSKSTSKPSKSTSKPSKSSSASMASKTSFASKASKSSSASKSSKVSKASKSSVSEAPPAAYTLTEQRPVYSAYELRQLNQSQAIASFAQAQREQQQQPQREQLHAQAAQQHAHAHAHAQPMSESDMSSFCSSMAASDRVPNMNIEYGAAHNRSRSCNSINEDHMSVSVVTDPFFGQVKHNMDFNQMTIANTGNNANRQYQQLQQQYEMEQRYQYQMQQQLLQQQQQGQGKSNGLTDSDYNEAMLRATQAAGANNSYGAAAMGSGNNEGSDIMFANQRHSTGSLMVDAATVQTEMSRVSRATQQTVEVSIQQQKFLLRMVKTLSRKLKKADDKIRRLNDKNTAMQELAVQLTKSEEQLEYASEENNEFSVRVRALEQALLMQETELDQALAVIRKNDQEERKREILEAEQETNPFAGKQVDEQLAMREELAAVREELELLLSERDMAVGKATKLSIQLAELRAESDEFRDQLSECNALIEHLRNTNHGSPNSVGGGKRGFFWGKKDDKSLPGNLGTSSNDDEVVDDEVADTTEENTSVSSDEWNAGTEEMSSHELRRHEETSMELTL
jgi:hypothetical protein